MAHPIVYCSYYDTIPAVPLSALIKINNNDSQCQSQFSIIFRKLLFTTDSKLYVLMTGGFPVDNSPYGEGRCVMWELQEATTVQGSMGITLPTMAVEFKRAIWPSVKPNIQWNNCGSPRGRNDAHEGSSRKRAETIFKFATSKRIRGIHVTCIQDDDSPTD